ncbi:hypothetical protein JML87_002864 [Escherichia coli]|nr:hypothetical protein [Escherichia coli]
MDIFLYSGGTLSGRLKLFVFALEQAWCALKVGIIGFHVDETTITRNMHKLFDKKNSFRVCIFKNKNDLYHIVTLENDQ